MPPVLEKPGKDGRSRVQRLQVMLQGPARESGTGSARGRGGGAGPCPAWGGRGSCPPTLQAPGPRPRGRARFGEL